jgi:hypothetical protein
LKRKYRLCHEGRMLHLDPLDLDGFILFDLIFFCHWEKRDRNLDFSLVASTACHKVGRVRYGWPLVSRCWVGYWCMGERGTGNVMGA